MTKFQLILTGVFVLFLITGVIIFSTYRGSSQDAVEVVVWGTVSQLVFDDVIKATSLYENKQFKVQYVEKSEESFDVEFIDALASGTGPDVFFLPSQKILKHRNKIFAIPYDVFTKRQFQDSFIEGTEIYMAPEGTLALPVSVDPLVMYWNRSIFRDTKLTMPPKYWDEFYDLAGLISKKDGALNILKSVVAFGEFNNISNAKEIILNLAMQAGTEVTIWDGTVVRSVFADSYQKPTVPAEAAVNFYTEFSNPSKVAYSWNRSLPNSTNYFLSGDLALYFGLASEIRTLQLKNPNLNFDVATVPISREGGVDISYANFNALAITKSARNPSAAFSVISILSSGEGAKAFNQYFKLPPARRDLLQVRPKDVYESIFYESAIRAQSWLDPEPSVSNVILKNMIESITSGRTRVSGAINNASKEFAALLK